MDSNAKKRKYQQISIADKMDIIQRFDRGEKNKDLALKFGVSHAAISYILRNKENIQKHFQLLSNQQGNQKRTRVGAIDDSVLEKAVFQWFIQKRSLGEPVSGPVLQEKARMFNEHLQGPSDFIASSGWITRFKQRHGIRELTVQGERLSSDVEGSSDFKEKVSQLLLSEQYDLDNVYNADETGLAWKALPRRTLASREERDAAGRKILKDRVTVMTCANATGSHRIKLLVIGKSQKPRCFKNVVNLPVTYRGQKSAWIDRKIFEDWYREEFLPAITSRKSGATEKFLLLLDNAPSHPPLAKLNAIDNRCTVMYFPPNVTALIQPMDQGVIEATKRLYRQAFLRNLLLQESRDARGIVEFLKGWTMRDCCRTIAQAWDSVTEVALANAWKRLLTDEVVHWNRTAVTEVTSLLNVIQSAGELYTDNDTEEWLQVDEYCPTWQILSDEQIIATANGEELIELPADEDIDGDENEQGGSCEEAPHPREVLAAMNSITKWYEHRWETQAQDFQSLRKMREIAVNEVLLEAKTSICAAKDSGK